MDKEPTSTHEEWGIGLTIAATALFMVGANLVFAVNARARTGENMFAEATIAIICFLFAVVFGAFGIYFIMVPKYARRMQERKDQDERPPARVVRLRTARGRAVVPHLRPLRKPRDDDDDPPPPKAA